MPQPVDDKVNDFLQYAIGVAVTFYVGTAGMLVAFIGRHGANARAESIRMSSHIRDEIKRLEDKMAAAENNQRRDEDKIWEAITEANNRTAQFQATVLKDMGQLATRDDLHQHEERIMALMRSKRGSD